ALRHESARQSAIAGLGQRRCHGLRRWDYDNFWRLPTQPPRYERDHDDHPWWHWRGAQHRGSPHLARGWCERARADCQALDHDAGGRHRYITAFVVTNVPVRAADALQRLNLGFIVWLAPTVVITPIIIVWNKKIRAGKRPRGMPPATVS